MVIGTRIRLQSTSEKRSRTPTGLTITQRRWEVLRRLVVPLPLLLTVATQPLRRMRRPTRLLAIHLHRFTRLHHQTLAVSLPTHPRWQREHPLRRRMPVVQRSAKHSRGRTKIRVIWSQIRAKPVHQPARILPLRRLARPQLEELAQRRLFVSIRMVDAYRMQMMMTRLGRFRQRTTRYLVTTLRGEKRLKYFLGWGTTQC